MPAVGDVVDARYELVRLIARGGMGMVFEAVHVHTRAAVAVKLLNEDSLTNENLRERMRREMRALAAVRHPNVVELFDAGDHDPWGPYVVMERIDGRPLDGILAARGRLAAIDAVHVGRQIADALAFAHARGVLHRDVKPTNVFVAWDPLGRELAKVIDFGIAWAPAAGQARLTLQNELLGTPAYMAPEQLLATGADARSDVYGLGATVYECLTGAPPYAGTYPEVLVQVGRGTLPRPVASFVSDVPAALASVVERALAHAPDARYPDARSFARALTSSLGLADDFGAHPSKRDDRPLSLLGAAPARANEGAAPVAAPAPARVEQRRRHARVPYVTEALVVRADGTPLEGRTEDVSEGGVLVVTPTPCGIGERVRVRFALPGSARLLVLDGVVRWARQAREKALLGVELVEATAEVRAALAAAVAR